MNTDFDARLDDAALKGVSGGNLNAGLSVGAISGTLGATTGGLIAGPAGAVIGGVIGGAAGFLFGLVQPHVRAQRQHH